MTRGVEAFHLHPPHSQEMVPSNACLKISSRSFFAIRTVYAVATGAGLGRRPGILIVAHHMAQPVR